MLFVTGLGGIILFAITLGVSDTLFFPAWIALLCTISVSYVFLRRHKLIASAWLYLSGMLVTFSLLLLKFGPTTAILFALVIPTVLSMLLIERQGVTILAFSSAGMMILGSVFQNNLFSTIGLVFVPVLTVILVAVIIHLYV